MPLSPSYECPFQVREAPLFTTDYCSFSSDKISRPPPKKKKCPDLRREIAPFLLSLIPFFFSYECPYFSSDKCPFSFVTSAFMYENGLKQSLTWVPCEPFTGSLMFSFIFFILLNRLHIECQVNFVEVDFIHSSYTFFRQVMTHKPSFRLCL